MSEATRAEVCAVAIAEAFRGDGEVLASPIGTLPQIGAKLAKLSFEPDLMMTDGVAPLVAQSVDRDDEVDDLYRKVFDELVEIMREDESKVERGVHVQAVAKLLERMADHCTNLAEQVIFLLKGEDVRHVGKLGKQ